MHSGSSAAAPCPTAGFNPAVATYIAFTSDTQKKYPLSRSTPVFFSLKTKQLIFKTASL